MVAVDLTTELPLGKRLALRLPVARARAARGQLTAPGAQGAGLAQPRHVLDSPTRTTPDQVPTVALLLYTSGTTGAPKGVPLRHRNLVANVVQGRAWVPGWRRARSPSSWRCRCSAYGVTVEMLLGIDLAPLVLLPQPEPVCSWTPST